MKKLYLLCLLLASAAARAQPANDDCGGATALPDEVAYCSGPAAFTTVGATASLLEDMTDYYAVCISQKPMMRDVWFTFVARRNSANITVTGAVQTNPGGTLRAPQFAIYEAACPTPDSSESVGCRSPFENPTTGDFLNGGNVLLSNLTLGETYYIIVGARQGNAGTFELCVDQFDAVPEPSSDCETGVILCDKSPFAVDFLQGRGQTQENLLSNNIACSATPGEQNSAWYKWTCDRPGNLTFVITPLGAAFNEDIDFVLFELPNGLDNCGSKDVLRQMFSGETNGLTPDLNLPCLGETGLSEADPDELENCGCDPGDNNFIQAIDMVAGRSYALVIMNFSGSGDGFSIEFGGSGTFVGPEASFSTTSSEVCVGDVLVFEDQSTSLDAIISREWDFGPTAEPRLASGPGPHSVVFGEPGSPDVRLVIETERDCREVARAQDVTVVCCQGQFTGAGAVVDVTCPGDMSGAIDLTAASGFAPGTLTYEWSTEATTEDISGLAPGTYTVTVSDASTCTDEFSFTVGGPAAFAFDTTIVMPECGGETDGSFEFAIVSGGAGAYEYSLNGGAFSDEARLTDIGIQTVNVVARDANGCTVEQDIEVNELILGVVPGVGLFTEPVCAGEATGTITLPIANGRPAYAYRLEGGAFQPGSTFDGLTAGAYELEVRDADDCRGFFDVEITAPPVLSFSVGGRNSTCFGDDDGAVLLAAEGGRPDYTFTEATLGVVDSNELTDLPPGGYDITVTDDNGCVLRETITLTEPDEILPVIVRANNVVCFGDSTGSFEVDASGGTPGYAFSADNETFATDSVVGGLPAGDFTLFVMDANGCLDSINGALTEPQEFIIDAGEGGAIFLGFDTLVRVIGNYSPVTYVWGPDSLPCLDPLCTGARAAPVFDTDYTVLGINAAGCTDTATLRLEVIQDRPVYAPNAFSPDDDGENDNFTLYGGRAVEVIEALRIYTRWGGLVFEREIFPAGVPGLGWDGRIDGRPANAAVFVYHATVRFVDGSTVNFAGDVTLVK